MKNIKFKIAVLASCAMSFVACEDELGDNINTNREPNVEARFFLTAGEASLATNLGGFLTNYGGFMAQYHTQSPGASQYLEIDEYNVGSDFADRFWQEAYAGGINDLDRVIELSANNTANLLIARCVRGYYFQVLTDFFGDIPYAETLSGPSNLNPSPVAQEAIYASLINSVESALANFRSSPSTSTFGDQDVFLNANMEEWEKFANTLLLKMHMRLSKRGSEDLAAINSLLDEDNFLEEEVAFDIYEDINNARNPFNDVQINRLRDVNNVASNSLLEFLALNNDNRIASIYRVDDEGNFEGIDQGDRTNVTEALVEMDMGITVSARLFSRPNVSSTQPVYLFTAAESSFLQAEALVRYRGGAGAQAKYEEGLRQSFDLRGATGVDDLITGNYMYPSAGSSEEIIEQIIVQKWVANAYFNTIESYFDQLRTGFPELITDGDPDYSKGNLIVSKNSILTGASSDKTPLSMFYSQAEVNRNSNINQKDDLLMPVWWAE